jgi:hypothetical protein
MSGGSLRDRSPRQTLSVSGERKERITGQKVTQGVSNVKRYHATASSASAVVRRVMSRSVILQRERSRAPRFSARSGFDARLRQGRSQRASAPAVSGGWR